MKTKEELDFSGLYQKIPLRLSSDPKDSLEFLNHIYTDEEVEIFMQTCTIEDYVFVLVALFKDKWPDTGKFILLISEESWSEKNGTVTKSHRSAKGRKDIEEIIFIHDYSENLPLRGHTESIELKFRTHHEKIENILKEVLKDKEILAQGSQIILNEECPISSVDFNESHLLIKLNLDVADYY